MCRCRFGYVSIKSIVHAQIKHCCYGDINIPIITKEIITDIVGILHAKANTIIPQHTWHWHTHARLRAYTHKRCAAKEFQLYSCAVQHARSFPTTKRELIIMQGLTKVVAAHIYLRYKWGSSNSTSTSRTSLQKGDP